MYKLSDILNVLILDIKSKMGPDVVTIPKGLGNSILISNSAITTSSRIQSIIRVTLLGQEVPFNLVAFINSELRRYGLDVVLDYTIKMNKTDFTQDKPMKAIKLNVSAWQRQLDRNNPNDISIEEAKWGIESAERLTTETAYMCSLYLKLWATNGDVLNKALGIIKGVLTKTKTKFYNSTFSLREQLKESSIISNAAVTTGQFPIIGDLPAQIGAEPYSTSNDGVVFGINYYSNEPYAIDFAKETEARNILVIAGSGKGKTYMITGAAQSALENGEKLCCVDIKGNEYTTLVRSVDGVILDLSESSSSFIDCVVRKKENVKNHKEYFERMDKMLLDVLCTLSGKELENRTIVIISNFISTLWTQLGVLAENEDTWYLTEELDIYKVYERFKKYCYNQFQVTERPDVFEVVEALARFLSKDTASKQLFRDPINVQELLDKRAIDFQFNILVGQEPDPILFKLRWIFMKEILTRFIYNNYSNDTRTMVIMEEAQVVGSDIMKLYVEQWTLGRSLMQDNIFIANSLKTITGNKEASAIFENATILLFSPLPVETKNIFIDNFELEAYRQMINELDSAQVKAPFFIYVKSGNYQPAIIFAESTGKRPKVMIPEKQSN